MISSPKEVAEEQLNYFNRKIRKLQENLPSSTGDPHETLDIALARWDKTHQREEFKLREISLVETLEILKSLGNNTTMGYEELDAMSLKIIAPIICEPIRYIVNLSITSRMFCHKWKIAKIVPLLKDNSLDRLQPSSYRPITMLPVISKIAENAVQSQLLDYMEKSGQRNRNSHGYRKMRSMMTATLQLTSILQKQLTGEMSPM